MEIFKKVWAYLISVKENNPYDLICLDVMMPKFDGLKVLKAIRDIESHREIQADKRAEIILTTALDKSLIAQNIFEFDYGVRQ